MTIETKYNIGDEVWVYMDGQCTKVEIVGYHIITYPDDGTPAAYKVVTPRGFTYRILEYHIFPTKEELLNSLWYENRRIFSKKNC